MKKNNMSLNRGQSMIEYGMMIALIIAGILIGGPLLINAINAHFKLLDSATQDSLTEKIQKGSFQTQNCVWTGWTKTNECGVPAGCQPLEQLQKKYCKIGNEVVATETQCEPSTSCCSQPVANACGASLASECTSRSALNPQFPSSHYQGTCTTPNNKNSFDCQIGEKITTITCGKLIQITSSQEDDDDDDEDVLFSETFWACTKDTFDECLPKCAPDLDNVLMVSKCHDDSDSRDLLSNEVKNRRITYAQQKPYRNITRFTPVEAQQDNSILNGTVKIPYAFLSAKQQCHPDRYCEAYCEQSSGAIYLPTSSGTSCAKAICEKTRHSSLDLPEHHFKTGFLPYEAQFTIDLFPYQQTTITFIDTDGKVQVLSPDLSIYPQQISVISNDLSIDITPFDDETSIAPGFSLIIEDECFAYQPSLLMPLDTPLLYACEKNRKLITDAKAYQRYCSAFDHAPYKNAWPNETDTHTLGCLVHDNPQNQSSVKYFVFCE